MPISSSSSATGTGDCVQKLLPASHCPARWLLTELMPGGKSHWRKASSEVNARLNGWLNQADNSPDGRQNR